MERVRCEVEKIDGKVLDFLKERGIKHFFTSDGSYFRDEKGHAYDTYTYVVDKDDYARHVEKIDYKQDIFVLIKATSTAFIFGRFQSNSEICFVGREPFLGAYTGAVVQQLASYNEAGMDGDTQYDVYSILLINTGIRYSPLTTVVTGSIEEFDDCPPF